jgi:hypothetical protein
MASIWICKPSCDTCLFHILGESNHLRPIYLSLVETAKFFQCVEPFSSSQQAIGPDSMSYAGPNG